MEFAGDDGATMGGTLDAAYTIKRRGIKRAVCADPRRSCSLGETTQALRWTQVRRSRSLPTRIPRP